ncbi:MAG: carbohydrate porin [Planctomycetes bacterium]|nr:carbohydrate porin [Planctomycetota bacterium]
MKIIMFIFPCLLCSTLFSQTVPNHEYHMHDTGHHDRHDLLKDGSLKFTFEPLLTWTYQHADKVLPGMPHSKAVLYYDVGGAFTFWNDDDGLGQLFYEMQGNIAGGTSPNPSLSSSLGSPYAMNDILTSVDYEFSALYWQQSLGNHGVRLRVGKLGVSSFFDTNAIANDSVADFMAEGFNKSITNPMPGNGFGANIEFDLDENKIFRFGMSNSEPITRTSGIRGMSSDHLFTIAELAITATPSIQEQEREGHYRFLVWNNGVTNSSGTGNVEGWGFLVNLDQKVYDNTTLFGRLGWGDSEVTPSDFSFSAGIEFDEPFNVENSKMGFAYQYAELSSGGEQNIAEWFYRTKLSDTNVYVGPVVQYYDDDNLDGSMIYGIRTSLSF